MAIENVELKPCPLCKGEAKMHVIQVGAIIGLQDDAFEIYCDECALKLAGYDKDEITTHWNNRENINEK